MKIQRFSSRSPVIHAVLVLAWTFVQISRVVAAPPLFPNRLVPTGRSPFSIVLVDFNGDGRLDVATANTQGNDVSILMGIGDGDFQSETRYAVGELPSDIAAADLNGDGKLDLVTVNQSSGDVSVLLGTVAGFFGPQRRFAAGDTPSGLAIADFNRDGNLDLAVTNAVFYGQVSVLLGKGDGTFGSPVPFAVGYQPVGIKVGDFNEDQIPDVVVTNFAGSFPNTTSDISILLGRGDGTFRPDMRFGVGIHPIDLAIGDFNRDGHQDLAVANLGSGIPGDLIQSDVSILLGRGDGTFDFGPRFKASSGPLSVIVGDFDQDSIQDLAVVNRFDGVSILGGRGDGSFLPARSFRVGNSPGQGTIGDVNGDGKLDLAVTLSDDMVALPLGAGDGTFGSTNPKAATDGASGLGVVDLDRDGRLDLLVSHLYSQAASSVLGQDNLGFAPETRIDVGSFPSSLALADCNSDGLMDFAVTNADTGSISVLLGRGDGTFQTRAGYPAPQGTASLTVGDFDGDQALDLIGSVGATLVLFPGRGDGTFGPRILFPSSSTIGRIVVGDFDSDGRQDVAFTGGGTVTVHLGSGHFSFGPPMQFSVGTGAKALAVDDFNGDHRLDLVVVNNQSNDVSVLLGRGNGTFSNQIRFPVGSKPQDIVSADFDGDGRRDLAVSNSGPGDVSVLLGRGDGTFRPGGRYLAQVVPTFLATGDFNRDGKPDLAVASDFQDVSLLVNQAPERPPNKPPRASAGTDQAVECASPAGTGVVLDGSESSDPDSTLGTNDDIAAFEWFENFGLPTQALIGTGVTLSITLPRGDHLITLRVRDRAGETDTDDVLIHVLDTIPPTLVVRMSPDLLWPANHRMVSVKVVWEISDMCDPAAALVLASATSSEPDDTAGNGDGNTTGDIQDASIGTPDTSVLLRAERMADGPGRVYTLTYTAMDASGNSASAVGLVTVPHDLGTGPEPVSLGLKAEGGPGMAHLYWNSVSGAEMYDVIQGEMSQVKAQDGVIRLGPVHVLASAQSGTSYSEDSSTALPPAGEAFFYLVQYRSGLTASGWGTESSPWPAEPTSCDIGCPGM